MKNLVRVLFGMLFMVAVSSCADSFAEAQDELIDEKSGTVGAVGGHYEGPE